MKKEMDVDSVLGLKNALVALLINKTTDTGGSFP
jgi:hypothetical protein